MPSLLVFDFVKSANQMPYYQRAINAQLYTPTYNSSAGLLQNFGVNIHEAINRGRRMAAEQDTLRDIHSTTPEGSYARFRDFINKGPHVKHPVDRMLYGNAPWYSR